MLVNASVKIADTEMEYIRFGKGERILIMIPGVGDGFKTVKGTALPFSLLYRAYAGDFTVYVFSRRNHLPEGFINEDMADDLAYAFDQLKIEKASVIGISQGGMIAQWLAIKYPALIDKLVLCVTSMKLTDPYSSAIEKWLEMAMNDDYKSIFVDSTERSYTEQKLKTYRPFYGLLTTFTRPKNLDRFMVNARACITQDTSNLVSSIDAPTLIIGGNQDRIVGVESSKELAKSIPNSELYLYDDYGHGLYEEAKDFNDRVIAFLNK